VSKFSSETAHRAATAPTPTTRTFEGAPAYERTAKWDLFLLGAVNMVGEGTFYEKATDRDDRYRALVHQVTVLDPDWVTNYVRYLRGQLNMRSAAVVAAAESALARRNNRTALPPHTTTTRHLVDAALLRADEPAEFLAYWIAATGSRTLPGGVQRGLADAVVRLFTQRAALKYDGGSRGVRMGDVIELVHPMPKDDGQSALFRWLLDRRHHPATIRADLTKLNVVSARARLTERVQENRDEVLAGESAADELRAAGMTWETLAGTGKMDAAAWEAQIPSMGVLALIRNLRNFDQAGISDDAARAVANALTNPALVRVSRAFPFRFLTAYLNAPSVRWSLPLEVALDLSTGNLPAFDGRTLVLVDTSASMEALLTDRSARRRPDQAEPARPRLVDVGALFGVALARKAVAAGGQVDLFGFADSVFVHAIPKAPGTTLRTVESFRSRIGEVGHGTRIDVALKLWDKHDRVVLFTDMQTHGFTETWGNSYGFTQAHRGGDLTAHIPASVPVFGVNLAGYAPTIVPPGGRMRFELGGFSDATFTQMSLLERAGAGRWPWEE